MDSCTVNYWGVECAGALGHAAVKTLRDYGFNVVAHNFPNGDQSRYHIALGNEADMPASEAQAQTAVDHLFAQGWPSASVVQIKVNV